MIFIDPKLWQVKATMNIYGAEWDGSSNPAWTRTDAAVDFPAPNPAVNNGNGSSPFDDLMPWSGMEVVDDATAGKLVKIPKYWYKWTRSGSTMKLQIADGPEEGFHVSPAHADRGDGQGERDVVYVGRYHCNTSYKSQAGSQPAASMTRAKARSRIHNLGGTIWQYDFAMYWTILMLYLVEYANWNSQAMIGYGCSPSGSKFNNGLTDSMLYHTGTTAASRTTYGCCQYRHIEGLWDNVRNWVDGIYCDGYDIYCISNPANFSDTSAGTLVGNIDGISPRSGYVSGYTDPVAPGFEYALFPNETNGGSATYVCDYVNVASSRQHIVCAGGFFSKNTYNGIFRLVANIVINTTDTDTGCRLMKLP